MGLIKYIMLILLVEFIFIGCFNNRGKISNEKQMNRGGLNIKQIKNKINEADSLLSSRDFQKIKVIVKLTNGKFEVMKDTSSWPDNIEETFNIVYNTRLKPILFKEVISGISGDFTNTYSYYFSDSGSTIAMNRISSFFNSNCTKNEPLTESQTFYYDSNFDLIKKNYRLFDSKNMNVDSSKCIFNYRFDYKILKSYKNLIVEKQLPFAIFGLH